MVTLATEFLGFSELVDEGSIISGRTSLSRKFLMATYENTSIRECSVQTFFARDFFEDQVTATAEPFIWEKTKLFRRFRTIRYGPTGIYPRLLLPGRVQQNENCFYYPSATYFVFKGIGVNGLIAMGYYRYPHRLKYYSGAAGDERPARYNYVEDFWEYWDGAAYVLSLATPELEQEAQDLVSNWLVLDWPDTILEGMLAKAWSKGGDERTRSAFSLYGSLKESIKSAELNESMDA